jgi:GNAT superfamily N-acetyltransferase
MGVVRVDPADDATLSAWDGLVRAALCADAPELPFPPYPEIAAQARATGPSMDREYWLLRAGGTPVAGCRLTLPLQDNVDTVDVLLGVHPDHRGTGHGRTLVEHLRRRAQDLGRWKIITSVSEPADGGENRAMRFAAAAGATRSLGELHSVLDLATVDPAQLAALGAAAGRAAAGYQLASWTGRCPDDLVDGYAALIAQLSVDAPAGDLGLEEERWDAARVREREAVLAAQGRTCVATVARSGPDGDLVAFTDIGVGRHDPANAFQWDTLVTGEHRGHRLGMLVKVANLARLREAFPAARRVHTWNADSNTHMVGINRALGFVEVARESSWRLDLGRGADLGG